MKIKFASNAIPNAILQQMDRIFKRILISLWRTGAEINLRAFQCNAIKLQICTKINNINPYMLLNTSEFFKIYVYDLFLEK